MPNSSDFLDDAQIFVAAGKGGDGSVHFRREKYVPLGGPDGGDGGVGASVILEADPTINTLHSFRFKRRFIGKDGAPGSASRRHGKDAHEVLIPVPTGTLIQDADTGELLADLRRAGDRFIAAKGGKGGLGNQHFATSTRQAPAFAEKGQPGEERGLRLELKLVADAGLVGLPNAGKSTLLAIMSAARPKIDSYPFTTLTPNLGVVAIGEYSFVAADIPGLIEGAHEGRGLGDRFLRHVERTRVLVHVLDASSSHVMRDFDQTSRELRLYDATLLDKPQIVVLNKMDLTDAQTRAPQAARRLSARGFQVLKVSGVTGEGISSLIGAIRRVLEELGTRDAEATDESVVEIVYRKPDDADRFTIERHRSTFLVRGATVERMVSMTDMESPEALERLQRQLKRIGVFQALQKQGVRAGAKVSIGSFEMVWAGELEESIAPARAMTGERKAPGNRRQTQKGTRASQGRRRS